MTTPRLTSLDGLRGMAAVSVVVFHLCLVSPKFGPGRLEVGADSTLTLGWLGATAVMVFFVISGFVLTLPALGRTTTRAWLSYYPQRVVRLYLPVAGAVAIAALAVVAAERGPVPGASDWLVRGHVLQLPGPGAVAGDLLLLVPADPPGALLTPLWSLRWELVFSLLLPIYVVVACTYRRHAVLLAAGALVAVMASSKIGGGWFAYLPVFALGSLMAVRRDDLEGIARGLTSLHWAGITLLSLLLVSAGDLLYLPSGIALASTDLGAALIVFVFVGNRSARRFGSSRYASWLGTISFSLYLVHETVLVNLAFAFELVDPLLLGLLVVPLSLLAAWAFHRAVEQPSHHLSRWVGQWISSDLPGAARAPESGSSARQSQR